jgi:deoxyribose-phosphate aldolase
LDFVCNYEAFKKWHIDLVKEEILKGTNLRKWSSIKLENDY